MPGWFHKIPNPGKPATLYQWGWVTKTEILSTITFPTPFRGNTGVVVTVTPEWQHDWVRSIETIRNVTGNGFQTYCENRAGDYYVNWIAIGLAPDDLVADAGETPDAATATKNAAPSSQPKGTYTPDTNAGKGS